MDSSKQVAEEVLRALRRILRRVSAHSKSLSANVGLTLPQLLCLKTIGELSEGDSDLSLAEASQAVQLSAPTVSRIVDRLERAGLVVRARAVRDRRKVRLGLTDAGRELYADLPVPLQDEFMTRLMKLEVDERAGLLRSLQRITELMDADELDAAPILQLGDSLRDA
mgnify:CR=1 FL=1